MENMRDMGDALPRAELLDHLSLEDFASGEAIREALRSLGHPHPSLAYDIGLLRCCKCEYVADGRNEFLNHLRAEHHNYGQADYVRTKRNLLARIGNRRNPGVQRNQANQTTMLSATEIAAWNGLDTDETLTPGERATFYNLIHLFD
jgi:hypothetical protein